MQPPPPPPSPIDAIQPADPTSPSASASSWTPPILPNAMRAPLGRNGQSPLQMPSPRGTKRLLASPGAAVQADSSASLALVPPLKLPPPPPALASALSYNALLSDDDRDFINCAEFVSFFAEDVEEGEQWEGERKKECRHERVYEEAAAPTAGPISEAATFQLPVSVTAPSLIPLERAVMLQHLPAHGRYISQRGREEGTEKEEAVSPGPPPEAESSPLPRAALEASPPRPPPSSSTPSFRRYISQRGCELLAQRKAMQLTHSLGRGPTAPSPTGKKRMQHSPCQQTLPRSSSFSHAYSSSSSHPPRPLLPPVPVQDSPQGLKLHAPACASAPPPPLPPSCPHTSFSSNLPPFLPPPLPFSRHKSTSAVTSAVLATAQTEAAKSTIGAAAAALVTALPAAEEEKRQPSQQEGHGHLLPPPPPPLHRPYRSFRVQLLQQQQHTQRHEAPSEKHQLQPSPPQPEISYPFSHSHVSPYRQQQQQRHQQQLKDEEEVSNFSPSLAPRFAPSPCHGGSPPPIPPPSQASEGAEGGGGRIRGVKEGGQGRGRGRGGMLQEGLGIWRRVGEGGGRGGGSVGRRTAVGSAYLGRGRGVRRRGGVADKVYLALNGDRLRGREAVERSKEDLLKMRGGLTFNAQRAAIQKSLVTSSGSSSGSVEKRSLQGAKEGGNGEKKKKKKKEEEEEEEEAKAHLSYPAWGLPEVLVRSYEEMGVHKLFPWQVECLEAGQGRVLREGRNLVYSAPTSGGKTLVAELLMVRALTHAVESGTAMFVVPFIALAEEKARYFRQIWAGLELGVKSFHSDAVDSSLTENVHVAVCTIERANALVNRLLERGELGRLKVVVVDELHMIGDDSRGFLIEVMLAKLRMAASLSPSLAGAVGGTHIQIVGLSATLPNLTQIASWLNAHLYITKFRPVQLSLLLCTGKHLEELKPLPPAHPPTPPSLPTSSWTRVRDLPPYHSDDTQAVIHLCLETVSLGQGVLIFCSNRAWTERCASQVARAISVGLKDDLLREKVRQGRKELLIRLNLTPVGLSADLESLVREGVAFHHAGVTMEERTLIEEGFKTGILSVIVATSTLAAGVNLPARRVIVRTRKGFNGAEIKAFEFHQMCGRAGRYGIDGSGEAILMTSEKELSLARAFASRPLPPMRSALQTGMGGGLERALLEVVMGKLAVGEEEEETGEGKGWMEVFARCTLFATQMGEGGEEAGEEGGVMGRFREALVYLVEHRFIEGRSSLKGEEREEDKMKMKTNQEEGREREEEEEAEKNWKEEKKGRGSAKDVSVVSLAGPPAAKPGPGSGATPVEQGQQEQLSAKRTPLLALRGTQLGAATFFSSMSPYDATLMLTALSQAARGGLILTSDLHLLYLCVPPNRTYFTPDWNDLVRRSQRWAPEVATVAAAVGVTERTLERLALGGRSWPMSREGGREKEREEEEGVARRFVYGLMLHEMLQEVPLVRLERGEVNRGTLQALRSDARMFCGMMGVFCKHLKWMALARLIQGLSVRLEYGVGEELVGLCRIDPELMHALRARALFDAGFQGADELAVASVEDVARVLVKSMPFEAETKGEGGRGGGGGGERGRADRVAERIAGLIVRKARGVVRKQLALTTAGACGKYEEGWRKQRAECGKDGERELIEDKRGSLEKRNITF